MFDGGWGTPEMAYPVHTRMAVGPPMKRANGGRQIPGRAGHRAPHVRAGFLGLSVVAVLASPGWPPGGLSVPLGGPPGFLPGHQGATPPLFVLVSLGRVVGIFWVRKFWAKVV